MKQILITTISAVLLVGCGKPQPPEISIHEAVFKGNIEAVKQHLAAGTDMNAKTKAGGTPLSFAARSGHKKIAELLIDKGADLKGTHAITPMHIAAEEGHKEVVELLIAKGADVNAMFVARVLVNHDWQGMTPIDTANEGNQSETADLIRKHGGKTSEELKAEGK